ncbi:MAG: Maf family protein [Nitrospira sp.]|nr:Maf family protein [Nitrospira sp.]
MSLILASTSPRRRDLLALLGIPFDVMPPTAEEIPSPMLAPGDQATQFALDKAQSIAERYTNDLVLGGDTVIDVDGLLLGKPKDLTEAEHMLRQLRGRCHAVHTGIALLHHASRTSVAHLATAWVWMTPFTDDELRRYLKTKESEGKAGAYSIQGEGARLIEKIEGDYPTIVGLPLRRTATLLAEHGLAIPHHVEDLYRLKPYGNWKDF